MYKKQNFFRVNSMSNIALFVALSYLAVQLVSNISSIKVGLVFNYAVDMGVFLYPLSFTLRDLVHRELGKELTKRCIYSAVLINLLMTGYFAFIALFASDPSSPAFDACLAHRRVFFAGSADQRAGRYGNLSHV